MTKLEFAARHGVTIRRVTEQDRLEARTDYQRAADFILACNGREHYSKRATLADIKYLIACCDGE